MKTIFCFICLFNICFVNGDINTSKNYGLYLNDDYLNSKDLNKNQDPIIRPCSFEDLDCIRQFFGQNFQCLPAKGPTPDPYGLHLIPDLHIPHANLTFILNNPQIKGLNKWEIKEFYINKATDKLVLEVVFDKIVVICPEANLQYHRKGKEPLEVSDYTIIEYKGLSFTLTISHVKEMQISRGNLYSYIPDTAPKYTLGPAIYGSKDPGFILAIAELELKVGLSLQEVFVNQGPVFFSIFLHSNVCDFRHN